MKNLKVLQVLVLSLCCLASGGCVWLVVGGAGAVGGYAMTRDTFEGVTSKGQDEIISAAHKVLSIMGTITDERPKDGEILAVVYDNHITVDVIPVNMTTCKLRVKARKHMLPSLGVAQDVYTKIINQLG